MVNVQVLLPQVNVKVWFPLVVGVPEATSNADWTPVYQTIDDFQMVLVPPGCFLMGYDDGSDDEKPVNQQCFNQPFWIDVESGVRTDDKFDLKKVVQLLRLVAKRAKLDSFERVVQ